MVLHQLRHQAIDGAARGGKALQNVGARLFLVQARSTPSSCPMTFLVRFGSLLRCGRPVNAVINCALRKYFIMVNLARPEACSPVLIGL